MLVARRYSASLAVVLLAVLAWALLATPAAGQSLDTDTLGADVLGPVEVHGFVSQGFFLSLGNDFIAQESTNGSFEFSEVGINFTKRLGETAQLGLQVFAQDFGLVGNYQPRLDWFYLDYQWQDWLGVRLGRLKIPYGLYNEIYDIDAARVPVLLPGSVYPLQSREILFAHSGVELYGFARSEWLGALEYRLFAGTVFFDPATLVPPNAGFSLTFNIEYVAGARLLWETPLAGLRVAGSVQALGFESDVLVPMMSILIENDSLLWVASAEYAPGDLTLTAEYARWQTVQTSTPLIQPDVDQQDERTYAMASYRLTPWFQPAAYYSLFYPNVEQRSGRENRQHDAALTLRFDVSAHWILKLEGHYMSGTAGLINPLRVNPPDVSQADETWATFFLKATGHF